MRAVTITKLGVYGGEGRCLANPLLQRIHRLAAATTLVDISLASSDPRQPNEQGRLEVNFVPI